MIPNGYVSIPEAAKQIGKNWQAVYRKAARLGLGIKEAGRRYVSPEEIEQLSRDNRSVATLGGVHEDRI